MFYNIALIGHCIKESNKKVLLQNRDHFPCFVEPDILKLSLWLPWIYFKCLGRKMSPSAVLSYYWCKGINYYGISKYEIICNHAQ